MKFISIICMFFTSWAHADGLVDGATLTPRSLIEVVERIPLGSIVVISELHGFVPHHRHQRELLAALAERKTRISVGLEFLSFDKQTEVDLFLEGKLTETDFLKAVEWGQISFDHYRDQATFSRRTGGRTLALNAPRWLTAKIAKTGLESLSAAERGLLPADFTLGNELYKARFRETMGGHVSEEAIDRYFQAQSVWDETMATTACGFHRENPDDDLVIIVGDFHAAYGGGLPDRLKARGCGDVYVISQVAEASEALPHPKWGQRAEWVWVTDPAGSSRLR